MNKVLGFAVLLFAYSSLADDGILKDFDSLGGNDVLLEQAKSLNPETRVQIVQKRVVDRNSRVEILPEFRAVTGGNTYLKTQGFGLNTKYHFNPYFSVGVKYNYFFNELTEEGRSIVDKTKEVDDSEDILLSLIPELNWLRHSYLATASFYPIYGKLNVFNQGIVHFDMYAQLGVGQVVLRNGTSDTYALGLGSGFWVSQHLSARLEYNYQTYKAESFTGLKETAVHSVSIGVGYFL